MAKKCPPGVICFENITLFLLLIVICVIFWYLHTYGKLNKDKSQKSDMDQKIIIEHSNNQPRDFGVFPRPEFGFTRFSGDVLMNPYAPPLRDNGYFPGSFGDPRGLPINIPTQGYDTTYRQVGILTRLDGQEQILPLMGRPLLTNRDKWQFYTMGNNNIKLPVSNNGRSCTNEYGCDNLYNGDTVYVEGYNDAFKVTVYDNAVMNYIPYM